MATRRSASAFARKALATLCAGALALACCTFASGCSVALKVISGGRSSTNAADTLGESIVRDDQVELLGGGDDDVTVMIYMNGSNLESEGGAGTLDLQEIVEAGDSEKVNVVIETLGTSKWESEFGIASDHTQIYEAGDGELTLVRDDLDQLDCTDPSTLSSFIQWSAQAYPANRYMLVLWDHGGGPVYGFGSDEWVSDYNATLTIDEMRTALSDGGVYFDFIGMDACLMSSLEVCYALYEHCDYAVLSEDFESSYGWDYTGWLRQLYQNSSTPTDELGKTLIDDTIEKTQSYLGNDTDAILALIDESMMKVLFGAWIDFAYANEEALLQNNYSQEVEENDQSPRGLNFAASSGKGTAGGGIGATKSYLDELFGSGSGYGDGSWGDYGGYGYSYDYDDSSYDDSFDWSEYFGDDYGSYDDYGSWDDDGHYDYGFDEYDPDYDGDYGDEYTGGWDYGDYFDSDWSDFTDFYDSYGVDISDYYITDIMALASTIESDESSALASAVSEAIVYVAACGDDTSMTGLSVTLPYGDSSFYEDLQTIFVNAGIDSDYVTWLAQFATTSGYSSFYDYDDWDNEWNGWDSYTDDYDWSDWDMDDYSFLDWLWS